MVELFELVASLKGDINPLEKDVVRARSLVQGLGKEIEKISGKPISLGQTTGSSQGFKNYTQEVDRASAATKAFQILFAGTFLGTLAGGGAIGAISAVNSGLQTLASTMLELGKRSIQLGADYEMTVNSMIVFTGSATKAKAELKDLAELSRNTPGLRLEDAEKGAARLRALGFSAKTTQDLVAGIAKQKILSGADEGAINRVIVNLTQLASGSPRMSSDIKEMIMSMATLKPAIVDTFGSIEKFKAALTKDPDAAMDKLAKGLADVKSAAGGFNDAWSKLADEFITAGRNFSEPIIPGLTDDIKSLTGFLRENKEAWGEWGQFAGDIIRGVRSQTGEKDVQNLTNFGSFGSRLMMGAATFGGSEVLRYSVGAIAENGKRQREAEENKPGYKEAQANKRLEELSKEAGVILAQRRRKEEAAKERARLIELNSLKKIGDESEALLRNRYQVDQALRDSYIRETSQDELQYLRQSAKAQNDYYTSEIARTTDYFDKQLSLSVSDESEIAKITADKNRTLSNLDKERQVAAYQNQKKIQEQERRIQEDRRQQAIESKNLELQQVNVFNDAQVKAVERAIDLRNISTQSGYDELLAIEDNAYAESLRLQSESLALQLDNKRLSAEQRVNIEKQFGIDELRLAEQHKDRVIQIEDEKRQRLIQSAQETSRQYLDALGVIGSNQSAFEGFFSPENFSVKSFNRIQTSLQGVYDAKKAELDKAQKEFDQLILAEEKSTPADKGEISGKRSQKAAEVERLKKELPFLNTEFKALGEAISRTFDFDTGGEMLLLREQTMERAALEEQIRLNVYEQNFARGAALEKLKSENKLLLGQKEIQATIQEIELERYRRSTVKGLTERLTGLRAGDENELAIFKDGAQRDVLKEQISYFRGSAYWQAKLAAIGEDSAERYKIAWTKALYDVKDADIRANESLIASQVRLADMTTLHADQVNARIAETLATQKSLTDIVADASTGAIEEFYSTIDDGTHALIESIGLAETAFGRLVESMLADLAKLAINQVFQQLFNPQAQQQSGGGSWWQKLLGIGVSVAGSLLGGKVAGGSSGGAGGSPSFNPSLGNGHMNFASGGFTGFGQKFQAAGIVHKGEFVFDQKATQHWGLSNLNKMLNLQMPAMAGGFADGGYTGGYVGASSPIVMPSNAPPASADNSRKTQINHFHLPNVKNPSDFRRSARQIMNEMREKQDGVRR